MRQLPKNLFKAVAAGDTAGLAQGLATSAPDQRDAGERTLLMVACRAGQTAAARLLLEAGADVNATNPNGTTALMYAKTAAVGSGNVDLLVLLVSAGADVNARDAGGRTALDYLMENTQTVIAYLISQGAHR